MLYLIDDQTLAELRRMLAKLDAIRGPGVVNAPDAITITPPPARRPPPEQRRHVPPRGLPNRSETFTANDTWEPPAKASLVQCLLIGGGGGGGGGSPDIAPPIENSDSTLYIGGAGGGGGAPGVALLVAFNPVGITSVDVTIGAGGDGGGISSSGSNGDSTRITLHRADESTIEATANGGQAGERALTTGGNVRVRPGRGGGVPSSSPTGGSAMHVLSLSPEVLVVAHGTPGGRDGVHGGVGLSDTVEGGYGGARSYPIIRRSNWGRSGSGGDGADVGGSASSGLAGSDGGAYFFWRE